MRPATPAVAQPDWHLKAAADRAGKPIYLELSSVNPVVITPQALDRACRRHRRRIHDQRADGDRSVLHQPWRGAAGERRCNRSVYRRCRPISSKPAAAGTLLSPAVAKSLAASVEKLCEFGADLLTGGGEPETDRCAYANTLLQASTASAFLGKP